MPGLGFLQHTLKSFEDVNNKINYFKNKSQIEREGSFPPQEMKWGKLKQFHNSFKTSIAYEDQKGK